MCLHVIFLGAEELGQGIPIDRHGGTQIGGSQQIRKFDSGADIAHEAENNRLEDR